MMCRKKGFSLIEVTLAILVISVGMITVMALLPEGLSLASKAKDESQMALLANSIFSDVQAQGHLDYINTVNSYRYIDPAGRYEIPINLLTSITNASTNAVSADFRVLLMMSEVQAGELCEVQLTMFPGAFGVANPKRFYSQFANYHIPP